MPMQLACQEGDSSSSHVDVTSVHPSAPEASLPRRSYSSSDLHGHADRTGRGTKLPLERSPLAPLLASSATTLPPAGGTPQDVHLPTPPHASTATVSPHGDSRHAIPGNEAAEQENSLLQAECHRLREDLLRERDERCALAVRVEALSRLWEAIYPVGNLAAADPLLVAKAAGLSAQPPASFTTAPVLAGTDGNASSSASQNIAMAQLQQAAAEPASPNSESHSSVKTLIDESSIVPEPSAVIGIHSFSCAAEASGTPPPNSGNNRSPRTVSPRAKGGIGENSAPFESHALRVSSHSDSKVKDSRRILEEMSASGVLDRDLGLRRGLNEDTKGSKEEVVMFLQGKVCLDRAREGKVMRAK